MDLNEIVSKIILIVFLLLTFGCYDVYAQDTLVKVITNKRDVPFAHGPPNTTYWSADDTVYAIRYLTIDTLLSLKYSRAMSNVWVTFYNDGRVMELGSFKKYKSRLNKNKNHLTMVKRGRWLYFDPGGKLIKSSTHSGDLADD